MILERSIFYRTRAKDYSSGATSVGRRHTYSSYTSATPNYQPDLEASATGSHQSSESISTLSWSPSTSSSLIHSPIHPFSSSGSLRAFSEESSRAGRLDGDSWSVSPSSSLPWARWGSQRSASSKASHQAVSPESPRHPQASHSLVPRLAQSQATFSLSSSKPPPPQTQRSSKASL